jgi:hypothetical protein
MRGMLLSQLFVSICLAQSGLADELVYFTNFNELDPFFSLSDQDGWLTNDIDSGGGFGATDGIGTLVKPSPSGSDTSNSGVVGGFRGEAFPPGVHDIYLWRPFTVTGNSLDFEVESVFLGSGTGGAFPFDDSFAWTIRDTMGNQIFRLAFEPTSLSNRLEVVSYDAADVAVPSGVDVFKGSLYTIKISVTPDGGGDRARASLFSGTNETVLADRWLPAGSLSSAAQVAANWRILNPSVNSSGLPDMYGSNFMMFDEYRITTSVPNAVFVESKAFGEAIGSVELEAGICEPLASDLEVFYTLSDINTVSGSDYVGIDPGTIPLIIPAGSKTGSITLVIIDDAVAEANEKLRFVVTGTDNSAILIGNAEAIITINDNDDVDKDGISSSWEIQYGLNRRNFRDALYDLDGDETINLVEYALGLDPTVSDLAGLPGLESDATSLSLTYRKNVEYTNLNYQVELSVDLENWQIIPDVLVSNQGTIETRKGSVTRDGRQFLRLSIVVIGE